MTIEIITEYAGWSKALDDPPGLALACYRAVGQSDPACTGEVAILLTDDAHMRALNKQFRRRDAPTNVLSFAGIADHGQLGDIALGFETCAREATQKNIALPHHTAHLIVHGLLHLIGYDHMQDEDANKMEALEVTILAKLGINNPYRDFKETH